MSLLTRPEPFGEFNRLMNTIFNAGEASATNRWMPAMDLIEAEGHFVLKADLPGLTEGDVSIEVQDNALTVSGERKAEHEERQRGWYRVERSFGRFSRSLTLPDGVDPEGIQATFDKGVLEIRIPKPEARKPRRVEIRAGANGDGAAAERPAVEGTASEKQSV
jgi:HSP20 family protein